jgi:hypothetical protein
LKARQPAVNVPFTVRRKHAGMNVTTHHTKIRLWTLAASLTIAASCNASGADLPAYSGRHGPPQVYGRAPVPQDDPALISAGPSTPILPGSSTLPGYYGRAFDYYYQGPYYGGGPYPTYFWRLPYACGVYGYC